MSAAVQFCGGIGLALLGWLLVRRFAKCIWQSPAAIAFDSLPVVLGWLVLLDMTARPLSSGLAIFALACGLAITDVTKRDVLREPVVFSDMSEFPQLFTHPELYFPFASKALVFGGGAALLAAIFFLLWLEPPLWWHPVLCTLGFAVFIFGVLALAREPYLGRAANLLRRFRLSGDPLADSSRLGLFSTLFIYGIIARAERKARRAGATPHFTSGVEKVGVAGTLPTIVIVQGESFFDARRLSSAISSALFEGFERCRSEAAQSGQLHVPAWGANTMRAEFAVLSGLSDDALGYDRFNPYHAFARCRLPSLAASLKDAGYRTVCIHPFDRRFYRRDLILEELGFDQFIGAESFTDAEMLNGWISDRALGRVICDVLARDGPRVFIFAITMENHGPWLTPGVNSLEFDPAPSLLDPEHRSLRRYLAGVGSFDDLLKTLHETLSRQDHPAVLAAYGDHLPSLPAYFDAQDHDNTDTDYVIWHSKKRGGEKQDLAAYELPEAILNVAFDA